MTGGKKDFVIFCLLLFESSILRSEGDNKKGDAKKKEAEKMFGRFDDKEYILRNLKNILSKDNHQLREVMYEDYRKTIESYVSILENLLKKEKEEYQEYFSYDFSDIIFFGGCALYATAFLGFIFYTFFSSST